VRRSTPDDFFERVHDVPLSPAALYLFAQELDGIIRGLHPLVRPPACHGVVDIDDGDDLGQQGDLAAL
jgi:hypothetical protein